ncbi:MAG: FimB/Mfa2 family fimbrial subunit, partial [Muribaculaceae bacterium]|nr:FimB/Mfa2 family fimbrial subunit [Muribaculaceae bacterium]
FTTSRLFYDNTTPDDMLYIRNLQSGKIFQFDLPQLLAKDIDRYTNRGWSEQEYLDREYDFNFKVVFNEEGDEWQYIDIFINMLSWSKRVQNVNL